MEQIYRRRLPYDDAYVMIEAFDCSLEIVIPKIELRLRGREVRHGEGPSYEDIQFQKFLSQATLEVIFYRLRTKFAGESVNDD